MNSPYPRMQAHSQYQSLALSSRLEGTGPHGLVAMLYEELLRSIDVISLLIAREKELTSNTHTHRARSILIALEGSLDFDRGAGVAETLAKVYRAMQVQLREALSEKDADKLAQLREGIVSISESWNKIVQG